MNHVNSDDTAVTGNELLRLQQENELLKKRLARKTAYIREKTQQLLTVAESSTLLPDELDDDTLLELDPLGIIFHSLSQSMSNLQRINDQFREGEERWRSIFMSMLTGLMIIRSDSHIIVDLNPAAAAMIGRSRDEIIGRKCHCFVCPAEEGKCPITDLQQDIDNSERVVLKADGTSLPVIKTVTRINLYGKEHLVEGLVDISDRKRAEADLAADRELMAITLANIGDAVITADQHGRVSLLNREGEELTGWSREEAIGRPFAELLDLRDGETSLHPAEAAAHLSSPGHEGEGTILKLVRRDGSVRTVSGRCRFVAGEDGPFGTILVLRDLTSQQQMENDLLKARKLESMGLLAGGIAHDFNNLLTGIMGNISLARQTVDAGSPAKERLKAAEDASRRAHELIQQLLSFSRKGAPVRKAASVASLIVDAAQHVPMEPDVSCRFEIPPDLWYAEMNRVQMGQVVQNLVLNAAQSMPAGGEVLVTAQNVTLTDSPTASLPAGRYVRISITDGGVGIPPAHQEIIFDPYYTTKENGTGLGLAIAYSIVLKHDGTITVESELGKGTSFHVLLPATDRLPPQQQKPTAPVPTTTHSGKILVMDDDAAIRDVARSILAHIGYEVQVTANGADAVDVFRREKEAGRPFDGAILDLTIPGAMGGKETLQHLKAIDPGIWAIVSSGNAIDPVMRHPHRYGFDGVMLKPYRVADLRAAIDGVLSRDASPATHG
jgi:PAS domain S-box-containing protein